MHLLVNGGRGTRLAHAGRQAGRANGEASDDAYGQFNSKTTRRGVLSWDTRSPNHGQARMDGWMLRLGACHQAYSW